MKIGQSLRLGKQFLTGRYNDYHVGRAISVMVLIGYGIEIFGCCKRGSIQIGCLARLVISHGHIIQADRTT